MHDSPESNERRAIGKLCRGVHENIIEIYSYGELKNSTYHFIDMDLCTFDLKQYLDSKGSTHGHGQTRAGSGLESGGRGSWLNSEEIWSILHQITNGVEFIHSHREVHRDLKPRNGKCGVDSH